VQHHFGGKDGILAAVLEHSFAHFAERLGDLDGAGPLEKRVDLFVERAWEHFGSPQFRSTFEILQHSGAASRDHGWQDPMLAAWNDVWTRLFGDAPRSRRKRIALQHYTVSVLAGLAALLRFESPSPVVLATELGLLKDTLVRELG
jgi:AcrR family transcriptional regulator